MMMMNSPLKENDVETLLSMHIKLRLLGACTEGITINCMWKNIPLSLTLFMIVKILFYVNTNCVVNVEF